MRLPRWFGCVAALGLVAAATQSADAQHYDATILQRMDAQDRRIAELEEMIARRPLAREASYGPDAQKKDPGWIDAHTQVWTHNFGGRLMFDYVDYTNQNADSLTNFGNIPSYGEFRSARLFVEGTGYGVYDYRLEMDFASELGTFDDPAVRMEDAYVAIRGVPILGRVVMGNQRVPFSLDALTRMEHIMFLERAKPVERDVPYQVFNALGPTDGDVSIRRVGIAAYNHTLEPRFAIQYGAFFEDIDPLEKQRINDDQGFEMAVRGVWLPMYANEGRQLIHLGGAFDWVDDADDIIYFGHRPEVHEGPITSASGVFLGPGEYYRAGLEAAAVLGPASVQTEYFYTRVPGPNLDYHGAYVQGSFFLTGENRGYDPHMGVFDRVMPLENFWIVNTPEGNSIGTGAWELAFRWSYVDMSDGGGGFPFPGPFNIAGIENNFTFGVNWYWNPYARMMFNYIHARDAYVAGPAPNPELDMFAVRWQVDF